MPFTALKCPPTIAALVVRRAPRQRDCEKDDRGGSTHVCQLTRQFGFVQAHAHAHTHLTPTIRGRRTLLCSLGKLLPPARLVNIFTFFCMCETHSRAIVHRAPGHNAHLRTIFKIYDNFMLRRAQACKHDPRTRQFQRKVSFPCTSHSHTHTHTHTITHIFTYVYERKHFISKKRKTLWK